MTDWPTLFRLRRRFRRAFGLAPNTIYRAVADHGEPRASRGRGARILGVTREPCPTCDARYQVPGHCRHCGPEHVRTIVPRVMARIGRK